MIGAFTQQIDLPEVLVAGFFLFFLAIVYYIRREDKREGYPLEEEKPRLNHSIVGFPTMPPSKTYKLLEGGTRTLPQEYERRTISAKSRFPFPGAPVYPVGEPLLAGIGPGAYALRRDTPFVMHDGSPQLEPLRKATDYSCVDPELDPRGMTIFGSDWLRAGVATDIWIDKGSKILRYIEVALEGEAERRLLPIFYAHVDGKAKEIRVDCVKAAQLLLAPILKSPDVVTAREEDRINGFYAGGYLYSMPLKEALL